MAFTVSPNTSGPLEDDLVTFQEVHNALLVIIALVIFYIPTVLRRLTRLSYTPIYFAIYRFQGIRIDFARYFPEYEDLSQRTPDEQNVLTHQWLRITVFSAFLDAVVIPLLVGAVIAWWLSPRLFTWFLAAFVTVKVLELSKGAWDFRRRHAGPTDKAWVLILIYIGYVLVCYEMLRTSFAWAHPAAAQYDVVTFFQNAGALVFGKLVVGILLISVIGVLFSEYVLHTRASDFDITAPQVPGDYQDHVTRSVVQLRSLMKGNNPRSDALALIVVETYIRPKWARIGEYALLAIARVIARERAARLTVGLCQMRLSIWEQFMSSSTRQDFEDPRSNYWACVAYLNSYDIDESSPPDEVTMMYTGSRNPYYTALYHLALTHVRNLLSVSLDGTADTAVAGPG